jgi:hypothetical protein
MLNSDRFITLWTSLPLVEALNMPDALGIHRFNTSQVYRFND